MNKINWELIAKHLSGNISTEEENELIGWVNECDENQIIFKQAKKFWNSSPKQLEFNPDTELAWNKFKVQLEEVEKEAKIRKLKPIPNIQYWVGIAASILLVFGIGYFLLKSASNDSLAELEQSVQTTDQLEVFYLPDSTLIWLNKNSKLSYSKEDGKKRTVYLEGEAFFEITKDSLNPFVVQTSTTNAKVLGTSFNLKAYQSQESAELIVATGEVEFSPKNNSQKVVLQKDECGVINREGNEVRKEKNERANYLSWKEDEKELRNTSLYKEEKVSSKLYLFNDYKWRDNLVKQTIIEGNIYNSAIFTSYKNVKLKVTYYDKNKKQTAVEYFTITKSVKPRNSIDYKYRLSNWLKGTKSVEVEISEANVIE